MVTFLEQWQDDCERLSDPWLMYEVRDQHDVGKWHCVTSREQLKFYNKMGFEIRRIESRALPFDLDDANSGGKIECYHGAPAKWKNCKFHRLESGLAFVGTNQDGKFFISLGNLRMKESPLKTTGDNRG